jgi:Cft2 family RNA processing exonuclease
MTSDTAATTTPPSGGTPAPISADGHSRDYRGPLGPLVLGVLTAAGRKVEQLMPGCVADLAALQTNPGAVTQLLNWLVKPAAAPLRAAARAALAASGPTAPSPGPDRRGDLPPLDNLDALVGETLAQPDPTFGLTLTPAADACLAAALTSQDLAHAEAAGSIVRQHLDDARRTRRQARRRADTPANQRAADRSRTQREHLRDQLNRARSRASIFEAECEALRTQVDELQTDASTLARRLQVAEQNLAALRADVRDPQLLARRLADLLPGALAGPSTIDPTDPEHHRNIHPAEAGPLPNHQRDAALAEARQLTARLVAATVRAGLPSDLAVHAARWLPELLAGLVAPTEPARVLAEHSLTVDVLGGGTEVGGSCVLVTAAGSRVLIDAGSRPGGSDADSLAPPRIGEALSRPLDAIVITHAHNDHAGWVPAVIARQPHVPVLVTEATAALLATMWRDSAKVLNRRAQEISNEGGQAPLPPYSREDVHRALARLKAVDVGVEQRIGGLSLQLFPAGHIVGAVGVVVRAGEQRAVISGDVSGPGQLSVGGISLPEAARGADLLVLETTYAGTARLIPRELVVRDFLTDVTQTVSAGGTVLVPAFALGRAQEVALLLARHLPEVDVLVDGLARDVCEIYTGQPGPDGEPLSVFAGRVRPVPRGQTHAQLVRPRPGVVIATSGMLHGGPSVAWARALLPDPRHRLMLVGYQDPDSPGGRLTELAAAGGGTFDLPGPDGLLEAVPVNAPVSSYQLGAHASADDLVEITSRVRPKDLMLVHGEPGAQRRFLERMRLRRQPALLADRPWRR